MQKRLAGILLKENKNKMALGVVMGQWEHLFLLYAYIHNKKNQSMTKILCWQLLLLLQKWL
jgi:hypothetical protein